MKNNSLALFMLPGCDIEIVQALDDEGSYRTLYHKTYNPGEDLKQNLLNAYYAFLQFEKEDWE